MSYPEPRYLAETGEVSATFRPADTEPNFGTEKVRWHYLGTGETTGGDFGLYKVEDNGSAWGPSEHFHRSITESFFVLSGTMSLYNGEEWLKARSGDYLYVPPGGLHGFRNESGEPASMLLLFTPGAPREEYFENVGKIGNLSQAEISAFFDKHDNYFTDRS
ncbi:cupin domain [Herbihabitans rhizosphaerae]|uniref:Cupin domain n=1 Tax=Herbihabitans rhizosphaerae TaxID=1872711 RepID=A0A4Q7KLG3_9PSEU|nr:cupin domain-containing protein [Herbihabitans rhizosphaerae]RZS37074.1 cupin domain [Herbihabitans rhizosphaerae]